MSRIREFLQLHRLQPGSRILLTLADGTTHKGQLIPLSFAAPTDSLIFLQDSILPNHADYFGIPLDQIQQLRETGFGPWPGQTTTANLLVPPDDDSAPDTNPPTDTPPDRSLSFDFFGTSKPTHAPALDLPPVLLLHEQQRYPSATDPLLWHNTQLPNGHPIRERRYLPESPTAAEPQPPLPWQRLYRSILEGLQQKPVGIVLTYPQETLAWAATALSWMLRDLPIPVIWVGVPPPERMRLPCLQQDIHQACRAAALADQAEMMVCIPEHPTSSRYLLFRPTQTMPWHTTHRTGWISKTPPLACLSADRYLLLRHDSPPRLATRTFLQEPGWMTSVWHLPLSPWMSPDLCTVLSALPLHGLILSSSRNELPPRSWKPVLQTLLEQSIPIYWLSRATTGPAHLYQSQEGCFWQSLGLLSLPSILPDVAWNKLCWVVGTTSTREHIHQRMLHPLAGEFDTP